MTAQEGSGGKGFTTCQHRDAPERNRRCQPKIEQNGPKGKQGRKAIRRRDPKGGGGATLTKLLF